MCCFDAHSTMSHFSRVLGLLEHVEELEALHDEPEQGGDRTTARQQVDLYERSNEVEFRRRYRMTKATFDKLFDWIKNEIGDETRGGRTSATNQLLICIRFYATGCYQEIYAENMTSSQPTICRIVHRISKILSAKLQEVVQFPTAERAEHVKRGFQAIAGFQT